jgi:hypothetical protein
MLKRRVKRTAVIAAGALGIAVSASGASASVTCGGSNLTERLPHEAAGPSASGFARALQGADDAQREAVVRKALLEGDIPHFLTHLKPVRFRGQMASGRAVEMTICVMPDYLAVGSDRDFIRVPMGMPTAIDVARAFGFMLPTRKMVDAIYQQADLRLEPRPLPAGAAMRTADYILRHEEIVRAQLGTVGPPEGLVAGHMKDVTLSKLLWSNPQRVAIYGWHRSDGTPIQPLSIVHGALYADYSHGVRLVSATAYVDSQPQPLAEILQSPELAPIVSDEGAIADVDKLMLMLGGASGSRRSVVSFAGQ